MKIIRFLTFAFSFILMFLYSVKLNKTLTIEQFNCQNFSFTKHNRDSPVLITGKEIF